MSGEVRADFLNLRVWAGALSVALQGAAHELKDSFGNVLSSREPDQAGTTETDIVLRGKPVAKLRAPDAQATLLKGALEATLSAELRALEASQALEGAELLDRDLSTLLELSELETIPLEDMFQHVLRILRSHIWVERSSVYATLDGFTLEGVTALGWGGDDDWKNLYSTAAGVAASTKKPYVVEDPAHDKHLQGKPGVEQIRNLVCLPLMHGTTLVGVLNLANRVGGPFTATDTRLVQRFSNLAAHVLQKHVYHARAKEFEQANENLGKYLSKKVAKNVEDSQELFLGGVMKKVVCLFSDIRGYTTLSEGTSPAQLVELLNFHFRHMHAIIEKHEGTIDKMVGDLVMAVWNIPKDQPDPELLAMKAALEMQKEMIRTVIPEWQRHGIDKVGMGIGVNAGMALAGNLGSDRFMNYTVIGDAVNTAQRLESKAKAGEIWMNEEMYPLMHGKLEKPLRREMEIRLKGKEETINALVYKPLKY